MELITMKPQTNAAGIPYPSLKKQDDYWKQKANTRADHNETGDECCPNCTEINKRIKEQAQRYYPMWDDPAYLEDHKTSF
jgi:hypothetical protein